jgi:glutaredoxin
VTPPEATPSSRPSLWGLALVLVLVAGGMQAWTWWRQERQADAVKAAAQAGQITMYTTNTCPYCAKARVWLNGHDIPWQECNIDQKASCRTTFEAQGSPGVPLLNVKGHWHLGFDPQWLARALQTEGRQPKPSDAGSPRP